MLIDLDFKIPDRLKVGTVHGNENYKITITRADAGPEGLLIKAVLADGTEGTPMFVERIQTGVYWAHSLDGYLREHTSYEMVIRDALDKTKPWAGQVFDELAWFGQYGVADNLEQVLAWKDAGFVKSDRLFVLGLCEISKAENGGWRWYKNGPYIGVQKPQAEHLGDEPVIEKVLSFHFIEVKERERATDAVKDGRP